jgi:DNA-binding protein YbaB
MSGEFRGTALGGAVRVDVDGHGRVRSVWVHPQAFRRLGPDRLGRGVVAAHAAARATTTSG